MQWNNRNHVAFLTRCTFLIWAELIRPEARQNWNASLLVEVFSDHLQLTVVLTQAYRLHMFPPRSCQAYFSCFKSSSAARERRGITTYLRFYGGAYGRERWRKPKIIPDLSHSESLWHNIFICSRKTSHYPFLIWKILSVCVGIKPQSEHPDVEPRVGRWFMTCNHKQCEVINICPSATAWPASLIPPSLTPHLIIWT